VNLGGRVVVAVTASGATLGIGAPAGRLLKRGYVTIIIAKSDPVKIIRFMPLNMACLRMMKPYS
jgi:hypothetical protein